MSRSTIIISVALAAAAIAAGTALTLALTMNSSPTPKPAAVVTVTPSDSAPAPVKFTVGSPEYEQLQACLFNAGYNGTRQPKDKSIPVIYFKGGGMPEIAFEVDTSVDPRTITPDTGKDTVLLKTAGCL